MVRLRKILQENRKIGTVSFTIILFGIGYCRHLLISNWGAAHGTQATYASENIVWLRQFFTNQGWLYTGNSKMLVNFIFLVLFGLLGYLFFRFYKLKHSALYFCFVHFGLSLIGIVAFIIGRYMQFALLEANSRDLIVFLQAPYIFVLIYFTNYLSLDKKL